MSNSKQKLKCERPPKYCYFRKNRWVYYPHRPGERRKEIVLKNGIKRLGNETPCHILHQIINDMIETPSNTIRKLLDMYLSSEQAKTLSASTLDGYGYYYKTITNMPLANGRLFGDMPYEIVTSGVIRKYLDKRLKQGVSTGANREIELLSASFNWAKERDIANKNPCTGVRHNKEKAKDVYITDKQYDALLEISKGKPLYFAAEITYLCRARGIEAWNITLDDINDDKGVFLLRTKGSLPEWTVWTERLRTVIDEALEYRDSVINSLQKKGNPINKLSNNLILTQDGLAYRKNARDSAWQRAYKKLVDSGIAFMEKEKRFSFHDIKAKGISDHELHESGHKSDRAKARYMRKTKEVKATR